MDQPKVKLNDGTEIPQLGFGVYMIAGDEATERACAVALDLGYRHIDTAHAYGNERGVGAAIRKSGVPREEVWVTSKLWPSEYGKGATMEGIKRMLERLGTGYIDLVLLHQQFGDWKGAWRDMERALDAGLVRSIGISNFDGPRLDEMLSFATVKPSVLQVECHPYYQQRELRRLLEPYGTRVESWYPLGHGDAGLLAEPVFAELAARYGKTPAQVILRWHLQEGTIVFPKTENPAHMAENIDVLDFALTDEEMEQVRALDCGRRYFTLGYEEQVAALSRFEPQD